MTVPESIQREILTFFSEHLAQKTGRGGKQIPDCGELQNALSGNDAESLWGLWIDRVQERAARLDLARWQDRLEAVPCGGDSLVSEILSFAAESGRTALHLDAVSPEKWLKMIQLAFPLWDEGEGLPADDPLRLILFGEIRLLFGRLYPELDAFSRFPALARQSIREGILTFTDKCGFPAAESFSAFRPITASWMRALMLAGSDENFLTAPVQKRLEKVLMGRLRLLRAGGGFYFDEPVFSADQSPEERLRRTLDWISDALLWIKTPQNRYLAKRIASEILEENPAGEKVLPLYRSVFLYQAGECSGKKSKTDSEAACFGESFPLAVLRSPDDWFSGAAAAVLPAEGKSRYEWEIDCAGLPLVRGEWPLQARWNGKALLPAGEWESLCEEKSSTRIYSEMMLPLTGGWRVERQLLWAVDEAVLLAADALIGPETEDQEDGEIEYTSSLALTPYFELVQDKAGFELTGFRAEEKRTAPHGRKKTRRPDGTPLVRLFPLTLPEWQTDTARGTFTLSDQKAVLTMTGRGPGLYAAYGFDFYEPRFDRPYTWRRLTVGRKMTKTADYEAVGFRYQAGVDTYLIYKSLGESLPRSVLGEHFDQNFVFARFEPDGKTERILEVEPPDEE